MTIKAPYFPFYPRDFASDGKVEAMTTLEVGAYILLLCKAWLEEPVGSIPNDDAVLARWARLDAAAWTECRATVLAPFVLGTDNRLHQKRMREEYAKLRASKRARSAAGKKAAQARWSQEGPSSGSDPPGEKCERNANAMPSGYGSVSDSNSDRRGPGGEGLAKIAAESGPEAGAENGIDPVAGPLGFAKFWDVYPRHVARSAALKAWIRIGVTQELLKTILAALDLQKQMPGWQKEKQYIPHASTWLNNRRWEDEVDPPKRELTPEEREAKRRQAADELRRRNELERSPGCKPPPGT